MNFGDLNDLIHNKAEEIALTSDIVFAGMQDSAFTDGIEVDVDSLVIDGKGHVIDAAGKARIFNINAGEITLKNIVFKNAFSMEDGGAVKLNGGKVIIENCRFTDNKSNGRGACLYCNLNTKTTVFNTQFFNNQSRESACIHNFNARVEISGSEFYDNQVKLNASTIINHKRARLLIRDTVFKNNAADNGGAILNFGKCEIFESLFINNITFDDGGAINNQAKSRLSISHTSFIENECGGDGGAVVNFSKASIDDALFLRNSSKNHGGAISNQKKGSLNISNTTFAYNDVEMNGGALTNWGEIDLKSSKFKNNASAEHGGAIFNQEGCVSNIESCDFSGNSCGYYGGAIFNWGDLNLEESSFMNNSSEFGGAINSAKKASMLISNSKFSQNASKNGAAIFNNSKHAKLICCEFMSHQSRNVAYNSKSMIFINSIFRDNVCEDIVFSDEEGMLSYAGGEFKDNCVLRSVVYCIGEVSSLANVIFVNNISKRQSCADIYNEGYMVLFAVEFNLPHKSILNKGIMDVKNMSTSKINNHHIINDFSKKSKSKNDFNALNKLINENDSLELDEDYRLDVVESEFYEGGIEIKRNGLVIDGRGHTIDGAHLSRIFIINAKDVVLKDITFRNGAFFNDFDKYLFGGGAIVVLKDASLRLENCIFVNNRSNSNGGAISNDGTIESMDCKFIKNKAEMYGGAIHNRQTLTTSNDEFKGNSSRIAGAIYNRGHLKIEKDISLKDNTSRFIEDIYNAGFVEESGFDDLIYDSSRVFKRHDTESFTYLMDEIENSDVVMLDRDIIFDYSKDFYLKYRLDIRKDLVIDGANHSIEYNLQDGETYFLDGANSSSLFRIRKKDIKVTFKNIIFKNCYSNGRDIIDNSADLTIEGCRFINCRVIGDDCLINNKNVLKIKNSNFSNNISSKQPLIDNSSKLEMSEVSFINNNSSAMGSCVTNSGEISVEKSQFKSNSTKNNAGCIYNGHDSSLRLVNVEFRDNDAEVDGGVIYNYGEMDVADSKFEDNLANDEGGAINNRTSGELKIINSRFISNESKTNGGAIFNYGKVDVADCEFIRNHAKNRSGAIEHTRPLDKRKSSHLKVSNTKFGQNSALEHDNIYSYDGADVEIKGMGDLNGN